VKIRNHVTIQYVSHSIILYEVKLLGKRILHEAQERKIKNIVVQQHAHRLNENDSVKNYNMIGKDML